MMKCAHNRFTQIIINSFSAAIIAVLVFSLFSSQPANAQDLYWQPTSGTSSWFTVGDWNTEYNGTGDNYIPAGTNYLHLNSGVCSLDAGSNAVVSRLDNTALWQGGSSYTLNIEAGATLSISNYFRIGNDRVDGTVNVRGTIELLNALNTSFTLGGYNTPLTNNTGILNIDGGTVIYGKDSGTSVMHIGGSSTGIVEITNGGVLYTKSSVYIGSGITTQSDGTVTIETGGVWTNDKYTTVGRAQTGNLGNGKLVINSGGAFHSMLAGYPCISVGPSGIGRLEVNGGEFIGRSAFNDTNSAAQRASIAVGESVGGTGVFIQNGGIIDAVGLRIGYSGGSGIAILSNGVFNAMSNSGSWPCFDIYDGDKLTIAGGSLLAYTNNGNGYVYSGGLLELKSGTLDLNEGFLATYSNATVRLIGPLADITVWWRSNTADPSNAVMELILTKDTGHISRMKSVFTGSYQPTAVPGILRAGLEGGACLLSTNEFAYLWANNYFDDSRAQVANYNLDLWDASEVSLGSGNGEEHRITLKAAALRGAVNIPGTVSFVDTAYGYIDVTDLDSGTLPEMEVILTLAPGAKTAAEIVQDLQSAGYTNSALGGANTVSMFIPESYITINSEYFAWDFRDFDGTVNATVSAVSFKYEPEGTSIIIR